MQHVVENVELNFDTSSLGSLSDPSAAVEQSFGVVDLCIIAGEAVWSV